MFNVDLMDLIIWLYLKKMQMLKLQNRWRSNEGEANGHISACGLCDKRAELLIRKRKQHIG
jgi:hypothetical protein